ncbi:MFS transporter, partial [Candidatus Saccharibacteria bacterium]|nr:MFS transporter [Candidatus Saccharibacteria bacterium]
PILGIYLVASAHLSLEQIALMLGLSALISLVLQLPAGYFADKFGNARAMKLGALIMLTHPLWYIFLPNFWGALIALELYTIGFTFLASGTIESLMHDTLVKLGREKEYTRRMGRAQSLGLIGNVIAVILVPLTFAVDHRLPFLVAFVTQIALYFLVRSFDYPDVPRNHAPKRPVAALKSIVTWQNVALFVFFGFVTSLAWTSGAGEYMQLRLQDVGVAVGLLGMVQAGGSLVGAGFGQILHIFDKVRPRLFYFLDLMFFVICLAGLGLAPNWPFAAGVAMLFVGWIRVRKTVFQAKLLAEIGHVYKATLLSAMSLFTNIWQIFVPGVLAWSILSQGNSLAAGYILFAGLAFAIGTFLWSLIWLTVRRKTQKTATG